MVEFSRGVVVADASDTKHFPQWMRGMLPALLFGFAAGVYVDQNYHVPDIKKWARTVFDKVEQTANDNKKQ